MKSTVSWLDRWVLANICCDKPVPADVYFDLKKKCNGVPEFQGKHIVYGIFSKSGFEQRMLDAAKENPDLNLSDQGE